MASPKPRLPWRFAEPAGERAPKFAQTTVEGIFLASGPSLKAHLRQATPLMDSDA
ncbi:uncharacterized protein DNG_07905 [Cephalotrichum gorgonifer]|uniref:Uncharacterized protein n=1 Tax=Cephalotrichum gorgonifer TaxID=2041049 RepID=A0AAE8SXW9_9PEZI|nr:uncharacterized protein DNG_07905 [Cephalotrichum gorgonifer]